MPGYSAFVHRASRSHRSAEKVAEHRQHAGGRPPYESSGMRYGVELAHHASTLDAVALVIAWVGHESQRHLKDLCHLEGIRYQHKRRLNQPDDRRDAKAGDGGVARQAPKHVDSATRQPCFFFGFAQRGGDLIVVARLDAAARERYLSRMVIEVIAATREQKTQRAGAFDNGNEDSGAGRVELFVRSPFLRPIERLFIVETPPQAGNR